MRKIIYATFLILLSATITFGQVTIYSQNFGTGSTLPANWYRTAGTNITVNNSNPSTGYSGASGGSNILFSNSGTGGQIVIFNGISTVGQTNVELSFGAIRSSASFPVMNIAWSSNNGSTWNNLSYAAPGNNWGIVGPISLPAAASGQSNILIRFYYVANNNAAAQFRIDDFKLTSSNIVAATYYSKSTGNLNLLTTWGTNPDGSGTNPPNFINPSQTFIIANNPTPTISSNWSVAGANSIVRVSSGSNFSVPQGLNYSGPIDVLDGAILTVNNKSQATLPVFNIVEANSTIVFANYTNGGFVIPARTYGNVTIINGLPGLSGNTTIAGTLTITPGATITSPTLNIGTQTLNLLGAVSVASGSIISTASGTVNYAQASDGQNVLPGTYGNLTFNNFVKILPGTGKTVFITGTFTPTKTSGHGISGSTINYNGTGDQTIATFFYNNITISGSGRNISFPNGGNISVGKIFTYGANNYNINTCTFSFNRRGDQSIPANFPYYNLFASVEGVKTITGGNLSVLNNLNITASVTLNSDNADITVGGNWSNSGTFIAGNHRVTINKGSSASQYIIGTNNFYDLRVGEDVSLTLNAPQSITNLLDFAGVANFNTNGNLILLSDATRTARIGDLSQVTFNGNVTVQRYIPGGTRAYRYLASPVQSATLNQLIDNVFITGPGDGFDLNNTRFASAHTFNTAANYWQPINSLTTAIPSGLGFRLYIRGDRTQTASLNDTSIVPNPVTLDFSGPIRKGNVPLTLAYATNTKRGFNLVGNPYPSTIDWTLIGKTNISSTLYIWVPSNNSAGGVYATWSNGTSTNGGTPLIASSQAFMVRTTSASNQLLITEAAKVIDSDPKLGFRVANEQPVNQFKLRLIDPKRNTDEAIIKFAAGATSDYDENLDAYKLENPGSGLNGLGLNLSSRTHYTTDLVINALPELSKGDTVYLNVATEAEGIHQLEIEGLSTSANATVFLFDSYTKSFTNLTEKPVYSFAIEAKDKNTFGSDRFSLYLKPAQSSEESHIAQVEILPNPNTGEFRFEILNSDAKLIHWEVYSATGVKVAEKSYESPTGKVSDRINLSSGNGVYLMKVQLDNQTIYKKILLQR